MHAFSVRATLGLSLSLVLISAAQAAGFVEDSKASLTARNYYFDRDYKGTSAQSAAREWAQGFIVRFNSGFTEGPVGFGLNAQGMLGIKLDSSPDRVGTGLLPYDPATREPDDDYSELGLTAKMKVSKTELQAGTISTLLPVMFASPSRLLPQTLRGSYLRSEDIDGFTLHAGWLDRMNQRDSSNYQKFTVAAPNGRFNGKAESDQFLFLGADWRWSDALTLKYYHASLQDLYRKDFVGFEHLQPIAGGRLKSDVRYFIAGEDGAARAGTVDNRNLAAMFSYALGAHTFGAGYMHLSGDSAMPYVAGTEPLVITEGSLSSEFINADERSWQVKYDYDFGGLGVPGLKGMLRYIDGSNIRLSEALGGDDRHEQETDVEVSYVVQSGSFKGVGLRVQHAWYRNDFAPATTFRDGNELRVNVDYTIALW